MSYLRYQRGLNRFKGVMGVMEAGLTEVCHLEATIQALGAQETQVMIVITKNLYPTAGTSLLYRKIKICQDQKGNNLRIGRGQGQGKATTYRSIWEINQIPWLKLVLIELQTRKSHRIKSQLTKQNRCRLVPRSQECPLSSVATDSEVGQVMLGVFQMAVVDLVTGYPR